MASRVQHVCVSLSGGGHRAALFGAGALLYLMDADKGAELSCVASVSGGSLTNAAVEQRPADNRRRGIPRASPAVDSSLLDEGNGVVSAAYDRLPRVWRAGAGNSDVSLFPSYPGWWALLPWAAALVVLGFWARNPLLTIPAPASFAELTR